MELVLLTALGVGAATVFGSLIGFAFKKASHTFSDIILSFAAGVMLAAAVIGLILPSVEYGGKYGILITVIGVFVGALCLNFIDKLVPHLHRLMGAEEETHHNANLSKVLLFVLAIAIHNLPEGIAAGVGFGSGNTSQALMIAGGIALQNIPEGMVIIADVGGRSLPSQDFCVRDVDGRGRGARHPARLFCREYRLRRSPLCLGICRWHNAIRHQRRNDSRDTRARTRAWCNLRVACWVLRDADKRRIIRIKKKRTAIQIVSRFFFYFS